MEVTINVEDYLSHDEIKKIAADAIKGAVAQDAERILDNAAYHPIFAAVDEALDGKAKDVIRDRALRVIMGLSEFCVFRRKDAWRKEDSIAYQILQQAIHDNESLIREKVAHVIDSHDYEKELRENDYLVEAVIEVMKRGLERKEG